MSREYSEDMDACLGKVYPVLDHGFVVAVDYMGTETTISNAARVSYQKGTKRVRSDVELLRYLIRHRHTSPLEQAEIALHMRLPIFVARQMIRHRTANVNEVSARYSALPEMFYVPDANQVRAQSAQNKQGRDGDLPPDLVERFIDTTTGTGGESFNEYSSFLQEGVARELARINLPLSTYTEWTWKTDVHNLLHFLSLRLDAHAQYEIRVYADVIASIVSRWLPNIWKAFVDYKLDAVTLSVHEADLLRTFLAQSGSVELVDRIERSPDLSAREKKEMMAALRLQRAPE